MTSNQYQVIVTPCRTIPWFVCYSFAASAAPLREKLRMIPGVKYDKETKQYLIPVEIHELLKKGEL